ncbi:MAG TPA: AMP-binding protein [Candidatus Dormibacteraeota bacterium]
MTDTETNDSQLDLLATHALRQPEKAALIRGDEVVTFKQLDERATRAANALLALGIQPGDRAAGMGFNSVEGAVLGSGLRRAGGIGVPVNYRLRGEELAYVLNDSGARVIWAGPEHVPVVEEARSRVEGDRSFVALAGDAPPGWLRYSELLAQAGTNKPDVPLAGIGASMIYTSGTTGHPKGAFRPTGAPLEAVLDIIGIFGLTQDEVHLLCGPGYHSAVNFFSSLNGLLGGTVVIQRKFDAREALELIAKHRVTNTFMAPTLLQRLTDVPAEERERLDLTSLRAIILGAAPCPYALKERAVAAFGPVLWEFYGATETGVNLVLRPEDQLRKPGSCGKPAPKHEIKLLDDDGREVPDGEPGTLWVRNEVLAEYYNRPDATAASTREDGFFTVGDVAYRDDEGYYFICDRKIDMIISGGVNIYPAEIEAVLHAHPAVLDAAVVGVPDDEWGESVKAVVMRRPGMDVDEAELIGFCAERLAGYKKPRTVDFVDDLPRDAAGKLLKRLIRAPYWEGAGRTI